MAKIIVLDESIQPSGTWKDRKARFVVAKAVKDHVDKLCLITSGNAGYSLAKIANPKKIKVVCIVDKDLDSKVIDRLKKVCHKVIPLDLGKKILNPEDVIALSRESDKEVIWDVTNGYAEAYSDMPDSFKKKKVDYWIVPVGSGEAFVGIYEGLLKNKSKATLVGVGVKSLHSFADKLSTPYTPYAQHIKRIVKAGNKLILLNEKEVMDTYEDYKEALQVEPSATVVWAALPKLKLKDEDVVVVVNSGSGV